MGHHMPSPPVKDRNLLSGIGEGSIEALLIHNTMPQRSPIQK